MKLSPGVNSHHDPDMMNSTPLGAIARAAEEYCIAGPPL